MRNKATKENMNLDLRRYGRNMYTKAENNGGSSDDGGGGSSASPVLDWIFPGLIGFVDVTDNDWPVDTSGGYGNWVLTGDIIPVDQLKEYVKSYAVERYGHISGTRTFNYVLEYNEAFDNQSPSFRGIEFTYDGDRDIIYMGSLNTYSFNAKLLKDGVAYLVGFDPGD